MKVPIVLGASAVIIAALLATHFVSASRDSRRIATLEEDLRALDHAYTVLENKQTSTDGAGSKDQSAMDEKTTPSTEGASNTSQPAMDEKTKASIMDVLQKTRKAVIANSESERTNLRLSDLVGQWQYSERYSLSTGTSIFDWTYVLSADRTFVQSLVAMKDGKPFKEQVTGTHSFDGGLVLKFDRGPTKKYKLVEFKQGAYGSATLLLLEDRFPLDRASVSANGEKWLRAKNSQ